NSTGELAPSSDSVRGMAAIQRHFTAGEVGPVTVLLVSPTDWNSGPGRDLVAHASRVFACLDNVAEVRSLTQPLGTPWAGVPPTRPDPSPKGLLGSLLRSVQQHADTARGQAAAAVRDAYVGTLPAAAGPAGGRPRSVTRL